jgi:hypothetical protein
MHDELDTARLRLDSSTRSDDPEKMEHEIWYRPNRDPAQTALSKLFTAIRELHQRKNCVWASGAVIANLVADEWGKIPETSTSAELYDIVLESYFDILNQIDSDPDAEMVG